MNDIIVKLLDREIEAPFNWKNKDYKFSKKKLKDIIDTGDVYTVERNVKIITLVGMQKIAKSAGIIERDMRMDVTPISGNRQQHAVSLWVSFYHQDDRKDWVRGSGEANVLNTGSFGTDGKAIESEKIDSRFKYNMAIKRAYCDAVLKLIGLFDLYSDKHSSDFERNMVNDTTLYDQEFNNPSDPSRL